MNIISGVHHVTAVTGDLKKNFSFYVNVLGLRFVKKTVNFDDPSAYHLYYGNDTGSPGTVLTFFYWPNLSPGTFGSSKISAVNFLAPEKSLDFWQKHLTKKGIKFNLEKYFDKDSLVFLDSEEMNIRLVFSGNPSSNHWDESPIESDFQIKHIQGVKLSVAELSEQSKDVFDYMGYQEKIEGENGSLFLNHQDGDSGLEIEKISSGPGSLGIGSIHHSAFRVSDKKTQEEVRDKLIDMGLQPTTFVDRFYFQSVYFMLPEGILFEIATDGPGFLIDEEKDFLGQNLCLPPQYQEHREMIEDSLEPFDTKSI